MVKDVETVRRYAILLSTLVAILALGATFYGGMGNLTQAATAGSYYVTVTVPPEAVQAIKERVETIKTVAEAVTVIVEVGEDTDVETVIKQAPITDLLEGAPVTPDISKFDKNNDGVVDVVDIVEVYVERGLLNKPPKVNKEFAETLLALLKSIYGPNLERFPSAEGKLWLLAMYKLAE